MERIISYFEHVQSWQRFLNLVAGILLFWVIEGMIPLARFRYKKIRHAGLNFVFTLSTVLVNVLFAFGIVWASQFTFQHRIGLLHIFRLPVWLFIIIGLMILDFISAWLIHWIQHQVKWMWKFHLVHHTDTWVDTTTANRHHPVESIFRAVFTFLAVLVSGAPIWLVYLYQFLSVLLSQFNHANISLPKWLDTALGWVIVSPDMHKIHHHYAQPLTDTNYGNIFSLWDRIFGTYAFVEQASSLRFGIDTHMDEKENNRLGKLFKLPFESYRPPPGSKFSEPENKA